MTFEIDISNRQQTIPIDSNAVHAAVLCALRMEQVASAVLSISIVDNAAIHALNRDHLQHDYPTDVISFQLDFSEGDDQLSELPAAGAAIEGEIIASAEMAASMAAAGQWSAQDELTLYVLHGLLHICGYDDLNPHDKSVMRSRERVILSSLGLTTVYSEDTEPHPCPRGSARGHTAPQAQPAIPATAEEHQTHRAEENSSSSAG